MLLCWLKATFISTNVYNIFQFVHQKYGLFPVKNAYFLQISYFNIFTSLKQKNVVFLHQNISNKQSYFYGNTTLAVCTAFSGSHFYGAAVCAPFGMRIR